MMIINITISTAVAVVVLDKLAQQISGPHVDEY
jgi:hypothetical protein